jgi:hypothetical protein
VSVRWGHREDQKSYLFDWSAKIQVPNGGIIEGIGDIQFRAPIDGYQSVIEYHFTARERKI